MQADLHKRFTRSQAWRKKQLKSLEVLLREIEAPLQTALALDLGKPKVEAFFELVGVQGELRLAQKQLKRWMAPRRVALPAVQQPGRTWVQDEPLGTVLILGPWNYPLMLVLRPLVSALAAGNTAVLKPSEQAPAVAQLLAEMVPSHFEADVVRVELGGAETAQALLKQPFDHVVFTGGTKIGREVMKAAAEQLIPVTLELGGKSPCIVLDDADLQVSARRIAWGRFLNAGQSCVAPDYVLVTPAMRQPLEAALKQAIAEFYGPDPRQSPDFGRLVSNRQFDRVDALLKGATVLHGGDRVREERYIAPTLVQGDPDSALMQEEIFAPVLPIIEVSDLEAALRFIAKRPKPLAAYLFSRSKAAQREVLQRSQSGSVVFNDVIVQAGVPGLPFGGVGPSGIGRCHGETGFRSLSNQKSVYQRPFALDLAWRYPPYGNRLSLLKRLLG
ncbi:aldehyde dehydrogenase family protein [Synechococcus sp. MIT S9452]|uniref:aldehyde dehydrogenase family protein n=1 Tax=Synechococcus sp. MIT S9452 TaxID=3082546 RepID=UPI0039A5FDE2